MAVLLTYLPIVVGVAIFIRLLLRVRRLKNFPPGPPTLPIIGNLYQMPTKDAHPQFEKWAREYGPVYSLILGTKTMVTPTARKYLRILMMGYGPRWRTSRKLVHTLLNVSAAKSYVPYQILENKQMLYEMLTKPESFLHNIRRYSDALTTTMVFGWRTPTYEDKKMKQLFDGFSEFADLNQTGPAALIDFFPWMRHLPGFLLLTQQKAREMHKREKALYLSHWPRAKEETAAETITRCFSEELVAAQKTEGFLDDQAAYISGTLLKAVSDTTSSTLYAFVQAMLLYPDVQRKAQEEIDRVVGEDRLPTMEDEPKLQYIRSIVKESLRWMPTTILGAGSHAVTQDDYYNGMLIPKGAGVMNNVWAIHMDPKRHADPRRFEPERYKDDFQSLGDAAANPDASKRDQFTFGAGRRICSGIHVAERSLFLGVSRVIWGFDIKPAVDADGKDIIPDQEKLTQGFVCMPEEFPAQITPRSEKKKQWKQPPLDVSLGRTRSKA